MSEQSVRQPVDFHSGIADKPGFIQRLLTKALGTGQRVAVIAPEAELRGLNVALWQSDATGFSAHATPGSPAHVRDASLCWLLLPHQADDAVAGAAVLIHAGGGSPETLSTAQRLIEVVGEGDDERLAARTRWRHYETQGLTMRHFKR